MPFPPGYYDGSAVRQVAAASKTITGGLSPSVWKNVRRDSAPEGVFSLQSNWSNWTNLQPTTAADGYLVHQ